MKGHFEDLTGTVGPYYTVLRRYGTYRAPNGKSSAVLWLCRCGCGTEFATRAADVKRGRIKSCGCLREITREEKEMKLRDFARKSHGGAPGTERRKDRLNDVPG